MGLLLIYSNSEQLLSALLLYDQGGLMQNCALLISFIRQDCWLNAFILVFQTNFWNEFWQRLFETPGCNAGNGQVHNRELFDKHISRKWRSQTYWNSEFPICAAPFALQLWANSTLNNLNMMKFYFTGLNLLSSVTGATTDSLVSLNKRNFFCLQTLHFNFQFETTIANYIVKNDQSWKIMEL